MQITATVPMRVDLAGGTLDVYPIYLFEGGGLTLNAAISIEARVHLSTRKDDVITITSTDLGVQESIDSIAHLRPGGPLSMVHYALLHYLPEGGLDISIESQAPTGSGLGASSALLMALSSALYALAGRSLDYQRIIDTGANIEAQVIGIPTGKQDYFPPLYGGLCAMWFEIGGWRLESLSTDRELLRLLSDRLIVSYTGVPHDSAVTNWAMLKRYIEKQGDTVARMRDIKAIALNMYSALRNRDFCGFYRLVDSEWQLRHGLAEGVSTPEIEAVIAAGRAAGAAASKICGAGGGGCMITFAEPTQLASVKRAMEAAGARILPANLVAEGLKLEMCD